MTFQNTFITRLLTILFFLLPLTLLASKEKKEPEFLGMKNTRIQSFNLSNVTIFSEAIFYNPYKAGVKLEEVLIDVYMSEKKLGTILNSEDGIKIKKKGTFEIPLLLNIKPGPTLISLVTQSAKLVSGKKVELSYKGYVKVKALGFVPVKVKIDAKDYYDWDDIFPDK